MRVAFLIWSVCLGSFSINLMNAKLDSNYLIIIWYSVISIALIGAGIFKTDPITNSTNSFTNVMHKVCGSIMILTYPIVGTIFTITYAGKFEMLNKLLVISLTILLWIGQFWFFGATFTAKKKNPNVKQGSPDVKIGWPNRIMVLFYVIWILIVSVVIN